MLFHHITTSFKFHHCRQCGHTFKHSKSFQLIRQFCQLLDPCESYTRVEGGSEAVPFVRMFYGAPSEYLWEDSQGVVHNIPQGEGGEQGDTLMPLLVAVGQHQATQPESTGHSHRCRKPGCGIERRFAFMRARRKLGIGQVSAHQSAMSLRGQPEQLIHQRVFGEGPRCRALPCQQGLKVLGTPQGHPESVRQFLEKVTTKHDLFAQPNSHGP